MKTREIDTRQFLARPGTQPINCNNDLLMIQEGLRPPLLKKDATINSKSFDDIVLLKQLKKTCNKPEGVYFTPREEKRRFILYLRNNVTDPSKKKFFHTTRSYVCTQTDMNNIIESLKDKRFEVTKLDIR